MGEITAALKNHGKHSLHLKKSITDKYACISEKRTDTKRKIEEVPIENAPGKNINIAVIVCASRSMRKKINDLTRLQK
jgi:uncharacterized protein (DUF1499 family)